MVLRAVLLILLAATPAAGASMRESSTFDASRVRGSFVNGVSGVRSVGMGGAFTAIADDPSAVATNPGGLGQLRTIQVEVVHDAFARFDPVDGAYGLEDMSLTFAAGSLPVSESAVMGIGLATFGYGEYERRDGFGALLGTETARDVVATLSFAVRNPGAGARDGYSGLAVEYVSDAAGGTALGLSAGGVTRFNRQVTGGWTLEHLGPESEGFSLPAALKLGLSFSDVTSSVPLRLALDVGYPFVQRNVWVSGGAEARVVPVLDLRLGYRWRAQRQGLDGLTGASAGFGVRLGNLRLDYAFRPFGGLVSSHRMGVSYRQVPRRKVERRAPEKMPELGGGIQGVPVDGAVTLPIQEADEKQLDKRRRREEKERRKDEFDDRTGEKVAPEEADKKNVDGLLPPPRELQLPGVGDEGKEEETGGPLAPVLKR